MKCSNPQCDYGIGLLSYRRAFSKSRYCSKNCRDSYVIKRAEPAVPGRAAATCVEWSFLQPVGNALPQMVPAVARARSR
jgi:hypothetical protein